MRRMGVIGSITALVTLFPTLSAAQVSISINALAVDPQTPTALYAATSDGRVLKSTDGGANWNATGLTNSAGIIQGESDLAQGALQHLHELYSLVRNDSKPRFRVECTGHFMSWENQRRLLHRVSKEWIKHGKVDGFTRGEFFIDTAGNLSPL
jgi:hypothetical protein